MEGNRVTKQKQLILDILCASPVPLTAGEIYERGVRQRPTLAKSTVYRNLEAMLARGEVTHGLLLNGESFYEAAGRQAHRHYLVCKGCNARVDLPACPIEQMQRDLADSTDFRITEHIVQLYGYCRDCVRAGRADEDEPGGRAGR